MRKLFCCLLAFSTVITSNFVFVSADNFKGDNRIGEYVMDLAYKNEYRNDDIVTDFSNSDTKDTKPILINSTLQDTNDSWTNAHSHLKCIKWEAIASSESDIVVDYIYAKSRTFDSNGSTIAQDEQSQNYSSYVSATSKPERVFNIGFSAIGNHVYKKSGYSDIAVETKATYP